MATENKGIKPPTSKRDRIRNPTPTFIEDEFQEYFCDMCGRSFKKQESNFYKSSGVMHKAHNGYIHTCKVCVGKLYTQHREIMSPADAVRRLCIMYDWYWNPDVYQERAKTGTDKSIIGSYLHRLAFGGNTQANKTYDDTIKEFYGEYQANRPGNRLDEELSDLLTDAFIIHEAETAKLGDEAQGIDVPHETRLFWGLGFSPAACVDLQNRYEQWMLEYGGDTEIDNGTRTIVKQICITEMQIMNAAIKGDSVSQLVNALNTLLGSGNLKPVQKKNENTEGQLDHIPLGMWIKRWENTKPIPEPDPEFRDVDGIIKYISVWFFGHICSVLNIKNRYATLYEEEVRKWKVERPEIDEDEEDIEGIFDQLFTADDEDEVADDDDDDWFGDLDE